MTIAGQDDAIEAIKQLKARYFRLMDTKQWDAYRQVFTDDMAFYFESQAAPTATSGDEFVAFVRSRLATALTVHHGHMPEIELTSPDSARGVWAMFDWVDDPDQHRAFQGFGQKNGAPPKMCLAPAASPTRQRSASFTRSTKKSPASMPTMPAARFTTRCSKC